MRNARHNVEDGHGTINYISNEKDVLDMTTNTKLSVVHFGQDEFKRCQIMEEKLKVSVVYRSK